MAVDKKTKRWADQIARDGAAGYASKVSGGTVGNFTSLDAGGDIADSGHKDVDYEDHNHNHQGGANQGVVLDHGAALTGLGDNDHAIYVNAVAAAPLTLAGQSVTFNYDGNHFGLSGNNLQGKAVLGDGTAGRKLRQVQLLLENGTNAATLKCTVSSLWNGDAIGVTDNVAKGATTGHFTLNAAGSQLDIEAAGLSGNCLMAQGSIAWNAGGTDLCANIYDSGANDIRIIITNSTTAVSLDMTTLVDTGTMAFNILYITDA